MNRRKLLAFIGLAPLAPIAAKASCVEMTPEQWNFGAASVDNMMCEILAQKAAKWTKPQGCMSITVEQTMYSWPLDASLGTARKQWPTSKT